MGLGREGEITDTHLDVHGLLVGLQLAACRYREEINGIRRDDDGEQKDGQAEGKGKSGEGRDGDGDGYVPLGGWGSRTPPGAKPLDLGGHHGQRPRAQH